MTLHYPSKGDLPETSGEMYTERKPVLAYTKSLGWTQAIRRQVGKGKFEWVCSSYDGNTLFSDEEITAWTKLPEPTRRRISSIQGHKKIAKVHVGKGCEDDKIKKNGV